MDEPRPATGLVINIIPSFWPCRHSFIPSFVHLLSKYWTPALCRTMPTVRTHQWATYFQSALMMLQPEGKRLSLNKRAWGGRRRRKELLWAISKVWDFILEAMKSYGRVLWQEVRWSICNLERSSICQQARERMWRGSRMAAGRPMVRL